MEQRLNKPRVFLSHSKADIDFVDRIYNDLRKCQIEPWLDSEEIRHGRPWLETIFESGLPACDCVLVYFTDNSLKSKMVKKEIDAGLISQMKDSGIAFLPYVNSASIREQLRPDIQALQAPIWNDENYYSFLPSIVAEIWRSFLERVVFNAINSEQNARLKAELELERAKKQLSKEDIFSKSENIEFNYVWQKFDRNEPVTYVEKEFEEDTKTWKTIRTINYQVHIGSIVAMLVKGGRFKYQHYLIKMMLDDIVQPQFTNENSEPSQPKRRCGVDSHPEILDELLMFGFIHKVVIPKAESSGSSRIRGFLQSSSSDSLVFSDKIERFKYWLAVKKLLPDSIILEKLSKNAEPAV